MPEQGELLDAQFPAQQFEISDVRSAAVVIVPRNRGPGAPLVIANNPSVREQVGYVPEVVGHAGTPGKEDHRNARARSLSPGQSHTFMLQNLLVHDAHFGRTRSGKPTRVRLR